MRVLIKEATVERTARDADRECRFFSVLFSTESRSRASNRPTTASLWLWIIGDHFWLRLIRLELRANALDWGGLLFELFGQKLNFFWCRALTIWKSLFHSAILPAVPRLACAR
jgi:hypothetical protein